jgi:hypothetical protein
VSAKTCTPIPVVLGTGNFARPIRENESRNREFQGF